VLATAYDNGWISGELFIYGLIIAGGVRLVHSLRRRRSTAVNVAGVVLMVVVALITIIGHDGAPSAPAAGNPDAAYLDASRRDMIAGCTSEGARRSYCECFADQMLERTGHDAARLRAMHAELDRLPRGSAPPAVLLQATQACSNLA
jgi:hypothetical protein